MRRFGVAASAMALLATWSLPATAQHRNELLVASEPGRFMIPLCQLRLSGKVGDGQRELKKGIEERDAAKRAEALGKAEAILTQAAAEDERNPSAWYYLARTYLAVGDVAGADSAFTRAQTMVPDCDIDINQYRQNAWATLANAGIEHQQQGQTAEAMTLFRDASTMFRGLPHVFENMGVVFANEGQIDSAAIYFGKALAIAENDSTLVENRNSAALNQALMLQRLGQHEEAIQVLDRYLSWNANDTDARRSKAYSFRELGRTEEADVIERELVAEFSAMNLDSLSTGDLMAVGVSHFNDKAYDRAADIFERAMTRNPWSRDAVYNLANAYLALETQLSEDSTATAALQDVKRKLVATSKRLLEIETLNEDGYRLLAQGYRDLHQDSLVQVAERLIALPVNIEVTQFAVRGSGARWVAIATGREAMDPAGQVIPPAPLTVVLEFLGESGQVLGAQELEVPALTPQAAQELRAEFEGSGVASWRYRRK